MALSIILIFSVVINQDVALAGYKPLSKIKYFLIGFFSIAPFVYFFRNQATDKRIKVLLYTLCVSTTFATIAGVVGMNTGFNYVSQKVVSLERNAGLSGMILNYAHNLAFFQIIILGLIIYKKESQKYINTYFLIGVFLINSWGLYLTYTRGAVLALLVGAPFFLFKKYKGKFVLMGVALFLLGSGLFFISGSNVYRPGSDRLRLSMWETAYTAFKERPLTGYGYLNFELHSREIKKRYNIEHPEFGGHAHNNFLEVMATTGIIGGIVFIAWILLWFIEMYRREDLVAKIALPFIVVFVVGGATQATIALGVNLFFIMAGYSISQVGEGKLLKEEQAGV
ncbi:O-antigen ligase family protein [Bacteriovorax stolpii]|uniref:O-antigen ligase family protein n=1 Tax=Bacteriovorax stolpii TaxID=960 RepID=UPI001315470D|nr:O-antigen ligase family protein [Bacteriovorax stolpii]